LYLKHKSAKEEDQVPVTLLIYDRTLPRKEKGEKVGESILERKGNRKVRKERKTAPHTAREGHTKFPKE